MLSVTIQSVVAPLKKLVNRITIQFFTYSDLLCKLDLPDP